MLATTRDADTLEAWLRRRADGVPLAWITGWTTFCGARLRVAPGVYVPRQQTRGTGAAGPRARAPRSGVALDLCTGAGAVAADLRRAVPDARVIGIDRDPRAARCARDNGVTAVVGDLAAVVHRPQAVDVLTAIAPYVPTAALGARPPTYSETTARRARRRTRRPRRGAAGGRRTRPGSAPGRMLIVEVGGSQDDALEPELARARASSPSTASARCRRRPAGHGPARRRWRRRDRSSLDG